MAKQRNRDRDAVRTKESSGGRFLRLSLTPRQPSRSREPILRNAPRKVSARAPWERQRLAGFQDNGPQARPFDQEVAGVPPAFKAFSRPARRQRSQGAFHGRLWRKI